MKVKTRADLQADKAFGPALVLKMVYLLPVGIHDNHRLDMLHTGYIPDVYPTHTGDIPLPGEKNEHRNYHTIN